ncbi:very-long-chain (3R)-3-hydroxyacyl-CoA dehydratase Phs1p [[Candida] jaroonii]|uniref:Very-long-chain (3R)-3-hydroxyacyl-CoA dehydratase Phs1p n=1 Tax=[Candida] jaroonii TaxID=467808 RepID=A0ACA9Y4H9_9ASCO|nr:very-long-chain (3R)-3-hydroxyacyl-CoA dehydratase Phs1p [[Candida] jaroonii]
MAHPQKWLIAYNSVSASLWSIVLFNTLFLGTLIGQPYLFEKTNFVTTIIQTCALVEVFNALFGIVRASFFTTLMQVYSRLLVVWGIWQFLPESPANSHWSYITVSIAWSLSEIIKYSFHTTTLKGETPDWLVWLRYSAFLVLYPLGVSSEMIIMYLSLDVGKAVSEYYYYFIWANLVIYIPALVHLYTHLLRQRKKALGKLKAKGEKKDEKKNE